MQIMPFRWFWICLRSTKYSAKGDTGLAICNVFSFVVSFSENLEFLINFDHYRSQKTKVNPHGSYCNFLLISSVLETV